MPDLLSTDTGTGKVYRHSVFSSTIRSSISAVTRQAVSWDGTNLLSGETGGGQKWYRHSAFTTTIKTSFAHTDCRGTMYDGTDNWTCSDTGNKIWQRTGFTSTIQTSWALTNPMGLAWNGTDVYATTFTKAIRYSARTSTIKDSFSYGGTVDARGCGIDSSGNWYICDTDSDKMKRYTGFTSSLSTSFAAPSTASADIGFNEVLVPNTTQGLWLHSRNPIGQFLRGSYEVKSY